MGKAGRWLRSFLTGKRGEKKETANPSESPLLSETQSCPISVAAHKEKKRWSFRRSTAAGRSSNSSELSVSAPVQGIAAETETEQRRQAIAVAVATAAAAEAAVAAAQAAAAVLRLTTSGTQERATAVEAAAATRIQSAFRGYLARKALCALRGLVKLQALVRGHLVRKQAAAALRCMQALVTAQERARAQRMRMAEEHHSIHRMSPQHPRSRHSQDMDRNAEENTKIVEMDLVASRGQTKSRNSYSIAHTGQKEHKLSGYYYGHARTPSNAEQFPHLSPAPSALTEMSPRACSGHLEEFSFVTAQSSPLFLSAISAPDPTHSCDNPFFPGYMANTESSRAKARRSQSAPRQRIESTYERQTSRRRASMEGRKIPRGEKMQRSSPQAALTINGHQHPWSIKFDRSSISLKDSECGSTSTVLITCANHWFPETRTESTGT